MWRPKATILLVFLAFLLAGGSSAGAEEEKRVALVIGNSAYQHAPALPNPRNDAAAVAEALRKVGFEVVEGLDLDRSAFLAKLRRFAKLVSTADVATFFYAGHGLQVGGENYFVPIDATLETEDDLAFEAIKFSFIMDLIESRVGTSIFFLDACRNNPFVERIARSLGRSRAVSVGSGLAEIFAGAGTLVAYATDPGNVALDGEGEHSPFTEALLKHIAEPGVEVRSMLTRVRRDVFEKTGGQQRPWDNSSLLREFYFVEPPAEAPPPPPPVAANSPDTALLERERIFWQGIQNSRVASDYQAYLELYPEGIFAPLARSRIERLQQQEAEVAALEPPSPEPPQTGRVIRMKEEKAKGKVEKAAPPPAPPSTEMAAVPQHEELPPPASDRVPIVAVPRERPEVMPEAAPPVAAAEPPAETASPPSPAPQLAALAEETPAEAAPTEPLPPKTAAPPAAPDVARLFARKPISLRAMSRVPGEYDCSYDGSFDGWVRDDSVALAPAAPGRVLARAGFRLQTRKVEGEAVALSTSEGELVVAHLLIVDPGATFRGVSASAAEICDPGLARWQAWNHLAESGQPGRGDSFRLSGFLIRTKEVRRTAPGSSGNCVAFEGFGRRLHWVGGFFCAADEGPVDADRVEQLLGQSRIAGTW